MYAHSHNSWRLVFAVLTGDPPVFYNVTWRRTADRGWKVGNTPRWDALWKNLTSSTKETKETKERVQKVCVHVRSVTLACDC